jgi:hypothetical protein
MQNISCFIEIKLFSKMIYYFCIRIKANQLLSFKFIFVFQLLNQQIIIINLKWKKELK